MAPVYSEAAAAAAVLVKSLQPRFTFCRRALVYHIQWEQVVQLYRVQTVTQGHPLLYLGNLLAVAVEDLPHLPVAETPMVETEERESMVGEVVVSQLAIPERPVWGGRER